MVECIKKVVYDNAPLRLSKFETKLLDGKFAKIVYDKENSTIYIGLKQNVTESDAWYLLDTLCEYQEDWEDWLWG